MLKAILDFFDQKLSADATASDENRAIRLATAALLVELVKMDGGMDAAEREAILRALRKNNFNRTETARELAISRRALTYKLQRLRAEGVPVDG